MLAQTWCNNAFITNNEMLKSLSFSSNKRVTKVPWELNIQCSDETFTLSRRIFVSTSLSLITLPTASVNSATPLSTSLQTLSSSKEFVSAGYDKQEYTNAITASRDTNISPKEVYDCIQSSYLRYPIEQIQLQKLNRTPRAWDVGAGAGVSTETLWRMGYRSIEAVDWSAKAWEKNVDEKKIPADVVFTPIDDERFVEERWLPEKLEKFDVIIFNFGVNEAKASVFNSIKSYLLCPPFSFLFCYSS